MTTETVFLELPDVRVTNTKVTISGTTYFLPNITPRRRRILAEPAYAEASARFEHAYYHPVDPREEHRS